MFNKKSNHKMKEKVVKGAMEVFYFKDFNCLYSIESLDDGDFNGRFKICYD
jgi:hypothetical protein